MVTKKITTEPVEDNYVSRSVERATVENQQRMITLLESIDWKLWEILKVANPEVADAATNNDDE